MCEVCTRHQRIIVCLRERLCECVCMCVRVCTYVHVCMINISSFLFRHWLRLKACAYVRLIACQHSPLTIASHSRLHHTHIIYDSVCMCANMWGYLPSAAARPGKCVTQGWLIVRRHFHFAITSHSHHVWLCVQICEDIYHLRQLAQASAWHKGD